MIVEIPIAGLRRRYPICMDWVSRFLVHSPRASDTGDITPGKSDRPIPNCAVLVESALSGDRGRGRGAPAKRVRTHR